MARRHTASTMSVRDALRAQQPTAEFNPVPLRPDRDEAHEAGLRLLAARDRDVRRIQRRTTINFYASLCILLASLAGLCYVAWVILNG